MAQTSRLPAVPVANGSADGNGLLRSYAVAPPLNQRYVRGAKETQQVAEAEAVTNRAVPPVAEVERTAATWRDATAPRERVLRRWVPIDETKERRLSAPRFGKSRVIGIPTIPTAPDTAPGPVPALGPVHPRWATWGQLERQLLTSGTHQVARQDPSRRVPVPSRLMDDASSVLLRLNRWGTLLTETRSRHAAP